MIKIRKSNDRGHAKHGWLDSHHTFSFANYHDSKFMGFRSLRVINEDRIEGGTGFDSHPHDSMEIISYVVKGSLEHKDSMGTKAVILPGEVQRMSAGKGVIHSEKNGIADQPTHFFQIWIMPDSEGGTPGYGQKSFESDLNQRKLTLVVSHDGRDGSLGIKQDADMYISRLKSGDQIEFGLRPKRGAWIQVVKGRISLNGEELITGDGAAIEDEKLLKFEAHEQSEFMLFDLI